MLEFLGWWFVASCAVSALFVVLRTIATHRREVDRLAAAWEYEMESARAGHRTIEA